MNVVVPKLLPDVPTTRILAIGRFPVTPDPEVMKSIMTMEVTQTAMLYLGGQIDQWFSRQDERGVVFLLDVDTVDEARCLLDGLPLGRAKLMTFDLIPLGPLKPLHLLLNAADA